MVTERMTLSRRGILVGSAAVALGAHGLAASQTPVPAEFGSFTERIGELMAIAPAAVDDAGDEQSILLTFADLERQLEAVGVPAPSGGEPPEGFIQVTEALPLSSNPFQYALTPEWPETFGFEPLSVGRTLEVGEPPNLVSIFAGIDTERARSALLGSGYQEVDQETGGSYLTVGEDLNLDTPVGRLGVGAMNQAALGEDLVIFTGKEAIIQQVTQVMAGYAPSLLEQGSFPDLMTTFAGDTVGVIALSPAALSGLGDVSAIQQIAFGVREGADNRDLESGGSEDVTSAEDLPDTRARVQVRIRYADAATAQAEAKAIPERWAEMDSLRAIPLPELMLVEESSVVESDQTVAAIDFRVKGPAGRWHQMIYALDLAAFVPAGQGSGTGT